MRTLKTYLVTVAIALVIVVAAVAAAQVVTRPVADERKAATFTVRGKVGGLYPGVRKILQAKVVNRFSHPIRVRLVTARVRSDVAGCPSGAVKVTPWRGTLRLRPHAAKKVPLKVRMRPTAPNACQGVRFTIRYGGKAVR